MLLRPIVRKIAESAAGGSSNVKAISAVSCGIRGSAMKSINRLMKRKNIANVIYLGPRPPFIARTFIPLPNLMSLKA